MRIATLIQKAVLVLLVTATGHLSAANYYLVFDSNCMDRLEYSYEETQPGNEFVLYSIIVGNGEKILLEVGLESRAPIRTLNTDVLTNCEQAQQIFGNDLATKVNNKIDQIYIVTPVNMGQQYRVASVNSASYFKYDGQSIIANSPQYRFDYLLNSNLRGDLSNGDARGNVYFIENLPLGPCEVIALRQTHGRENNYLDIYVVPEIGVVEEKSSLANTSFRLTRVNNTPFADYVSRVCGAAVASNVVNEGPSNYNESGLFAKNPNQGNNSTFTSIQPAVIHTVKKGETLFRIASQYEIGLADLKVWNNLSTDVIYPGNDLLVSAPAMQILQDNNYNEGFTAKGQTSGVQSYGSTDLFNTVTANGQPAWTQTSGRHVVQSGETVLSIARLYGFTEERFRFFNTLKPTTQVKAGDVLVTSDCEVPAAGMQSKGVSNYSTIPGNTSTNTGYNPSTNYKYTNDQNPPYIDSYNDFDPNYPAEFQNQPQNLNNNNPVQNYSFPPGATAKSPAANIQTGNVNDNFYSPSNYGPVPGSYNNNAPLPEPSNYSYPTQNQNDPTNYQNYVQPNANTTQTRGAVPPSTTRKAPGTSTRPPYGGLPDNYSTPLNNNLQTKGITATYETNFPLTGVKKVHVVKENETLATIAARYGTSVARLRALNEMDKNEIVIPFQSIYVQK
jgi:LysM repeat protein